MEFKLDTRLTAWYALLSCKHDVPLRNFVHFVTAVITNAVHLASPVLNVSLSCSQIQVYDHQGFSAYWTLISVLDNFGLQDNIKQFNMNLGW